MSVESHHLLFAVSLKTFIVYKTSFQFDIDFFKKYLIENKTDEKHILTFELDLAKDIRYRNPLELARAVRDTVEEKEEEYYLFVDEIQMSDEIPNPYNPDGKKITFYDALNDLKSISNLDIYVSGAFYQYIIMKHF